jgi:hypothetical protein
MKYLSLIITLVFAATSYASPAGNTARYEPEQLSDISLSVTSRGYLLTYRTPLESIYFSPGIKLIEKEGSTYIEVVRCQIDHECAVDLKSTYGDSGISKVVIDSDGSKDGIFLLGSETSFSF